MLDILNTNINSLGRSIALYLFVYNNVNYLLGSIRDTSRFTMETCAGHSFLNSVHPLLSTLALFLLIHMFVAKGTVLCFLRDLENTDQVPPLLSLCWLFWKMRDPIKKLSLSFLLIKWRCFHRVWTLAEQ